jgi:hypothetical protein
MASGDCIARFPLLQPAVIIGSLLSPKTDMPVHSASSTLETQGVGQPLDFDARPRQRSIQVSGE